jgi:carboxymethylenebutenolidase
LSRTDVTIPTPEGDMRSFVFTPGQGQGPWPTVMFIMDAPAIRPALFEMGERLASNGYYVLMPDMFWRLGPYEPIDVKAVSADPERRAATFGRMMGSTNPQKAVADVGAALKWLEGQPEAKADKVGMIGYCMGGGICLRSAAAYPDRVAAVGAFHAGNLATDAPESPHLLAPQIKAKVLVAGADKDATFSDEACARLDKALKDAGVDAEVTIYRGALHGYAPSDTPVHNAEAAERHWRDMLALFKATIG